MQAPDTPGAEYILYDGRPQHSEPAYAPIPPERRIVAYIKIEGEPKRMALPDGAKLAKYSLPPLPAVTGTQSATYGILIDDSNNVTFTINKVPFDPNKALQLHLNDVDEWTLTAWNSPRIDQIFGPVSHPFHIHVNPFEVISITDTNGKEMQTEPVWKDTIILHPGWTVKIRTQYKDFIGTFVQHCHILDHEDQGMMRLIEITDTSGQANIAKRKAPAIRVASPYPAPQWELPDSSGRLWKLSQFTNKPTVLILFEGYKCLRCATQLAEYAKYAQDFKERNINVVAISGGTAEELREAAQNGNLPFPVLVDADHRVFRNYACYCGCPLHGTFIVDCQGNVRWQNVATEPYLDIKEIESQAQRLVPEGALADLSNPLPTDDQ